MNPAGTCVEPKAAAGLSSANPCWFYWTRLKTTETPVASGLDVDASRSGRASTFELPHFLNSLYSQMWVIRDPEVAES